MAATTDFGQVGLGLSIASGISNIMAAEAQSYSYEVQAYRSKVLGQQAVSAAKVTNLKLTQNYNEIAAANAVMAGISGRAFNSGTLQNMKRADQEKLNWDIEYSTLSGRIGKVGAEAEATGYESAAKQAKAAGVQKGLLQAIGTYAQFKQIG